MNDPAIATRFPMGFVPEVDFAGRQIPGARPNQQDSYGVVPPEELGMDRDLLVIVADGMGGHAGGEIASRIAVDGFARTFLDSSAPSDSGRLWDGLEAANERVRVEIETSGGHLEGMGTTLVALLLRERVARWISIGDSPLYLIRRGTIKRLNRIHSFAERIREQVRQGLTPDPGGDSPANQHALMAAVIGERLEEVDDPAAINLEPGDLLIAATDGLDTLDDEKLTELAALPAGSAAAIAERVLDAVVAFGKPNQDNATLVVVRIPRHFQLSGHA